MPLQCAADRYSPSGRLAAGSIEPHDIGALLARSSSSGPSAPRERKSLKSDILLHARFYSSRFFSLLSDNHDNRLPMVNPQTYLFFHRFLLWP